MLDTNGQGLVHIGDTQRSRVEVKRAARGVIKAGRRQAASIQGERAITGDIRRTGDLEMLVR